MTLSPECPVCANDSSPIYWTGESRMFRCGGCGLAFVSPLPPDDYLASFYSRFHAVLEHGGGYELTESRMNADFPAKARKIMREVGAERFRLLDVGCGKGFFVKTCVDLGIEAEGVDLSDTAIRHATEVLGLKAVCTRIEDVSEGVGEFDAVSFWATVEHLPRPVETLIAIRRMLKSGGMLFLDTGIGNDWLDRLLPGVNQWYDPPQHLYVFSREAIARALVQAGFVVKAIDTNYERSKARLFIKSTRNVVAAIGLRAVAELARCNGKKNGSFCFTRFPMGNLMSIVAVNE